MQSTFNVNQTTESSNENLISEKKQAQIMKKQTQQNNETALHASLHQKKLQQKYNLTSRMMLRKFITNLIELY